MGLEKVYQLTNVVGSVYRLRLEYQDMQEVNLMQEYSTFRIESEANRYRLRVSNCSCTWLPPSSMADQLDDELNYGSPSHNGRNFSTFDRQDDDGCANIDGAGWWFLGGTCKRIGLNGKPGASHFSYTRSDGTSSTELYRSRMMMLRVA